MKKRQPRSYRVAAPAAPEHKEISVAHRARRASWLLLGLAVFVIAFRPIAADDFWWDLSRGREVLRGTFTPSRILLTLDSVPEADWLGGVPLFLVYSLSGSMGLMLLRIAAAVALTWSICRVARGYHPALLTVLAFAGLIGAERAFDLGPRMFDAAGIVTVFWMAKHLASAATLRALFPLATLFVIWANTGPHVVVGWIVLASTLLLARGTENRLPSSLILIVAAAAMCMTPRGVMTIRDSFLLVVPQLATESWALAGTPWEPLLWSAWGAAEMAYLGMSCVLVALIVLPNRHRDWRMVPTCCTALLLPWLSVGNLEQAAILSVLLIGGMYGEFKLSSSERAELPRPPLASPRLLASGAAVMGCALLIACGGPFTLLAETGWGLHRNLDNRLLSLAISSAEAHGTAFADNVRGAGMLCWLAPGSLQVQDVPQRAILSGRWSQQQLIHADLRLERQNSYWRDDGSQGGWWIPLRQRDTSLVVIDADDTDLIRGLEPSIWKPLSIDSTVIPYAAAGDPAYNDRLIEVLQQRELVNLGPWTYSPSLSTNSEFDRDRFGFRPEIVDPAVILRQARVFRAMQLPLAALKVLHAVLPHSATRELRAEFAICQMELAHLESVTAGRPSQFRGLSLREALRRTDRVPSVSTALLKGLDDVPADLSRSIDFYLSGALSQARQVLTLESPESKYAAACIAMEAGKLPEAAAILRGASGTNADRALALLIAARLEEVEGYQ